MNVTQGVLWFKPGDFLWLEISPEDFKTVASFVQPLQIATDVIIMFVGAENVS